MDNIKQKIDIELSIIELNNDMRNKIKRKVTERKPHRLLKNIAACLAVLIMGSTTVFAGYYVLNKINVNDTVLPELDPMHVIQISKLEGEMDEYGWLERSFKDYESIKTELGIQLLGSELSSDNPYMQVNFRTDTKDFAIITVDNYILGDTSNYQYNTEENRYIYEHGNNYYTPISLTVDVILSENQLKNGWDTDYLGLYEFVENYTSAHGYKVNIIESGGEANGKTEKCAILVADGIRYTLRGRVSIDTIKQIVDTLK